MATANISLNTPANGSFVNTWDVPVNANWNSIDNCVGGSVLINAVSASGIIPLTLNEYTPRIITINGALTANVNYQLPSGIGGMWSFGNLTTGAFTVTFSSAGGGTAISVDQGTRNLLLSDGTNVIPAISSISVPLGIISMWSGSVASIPTNWHLCDGTSGTVDLRSSFVVGAGGVYAVGAVGGAASQGTTVTVNSHTLVLSEIPSHNHGVNDPTHNHTLVDPHHSHTLSQLNAAILDSAGAIDLTAPGSFPVSSVGTPSSDSAATGISLDAAATGITTQNAGSDGGHSHTGSVANWDNRPPFYALAFIQKIA